MRRDGRLPDKMRRVTIERNFIKHAEGSCLISLGDTKVVCTASVEERVPAFVEELGGGGWITAEYGMLPRSTEKRMTRDRSFGGRAQEIQRLIGRALRAAVDLKQLGQRTIFIDCDVIQADGGTRVASITGGFVALVDALVYLRRAGALQTFPLKDFVAAVSVGIVDSIPMLDLCYEEDFRAEVDMNVVMTGSGKFIEIQGTGEERAFSREELERLLELARRGIEELIGVQKEVLEDSLKLVRK